MLLRIKIKNFLSFFEEVSFDMFPNVKKTSFSNHVYKENNPIPVLKQAAIYGANGSGKSNLLRALDFVKKTAIEKNYLNKEIIHKHKFRLIHENNDPICISMEFKSGQEYYIYSIEWSELQIKEEVFIFGKGHSENLLIYSRNGNVFNTPETISPEVKKAIDKLLANNPYSSLLSLNKEFPIFNNQNVESIYQWFDHSIEILSLNRVLPSLIGQMSTNNNLLVFVNEIFQKIGLGIDAIEISSENINNIFTNEDDEESRKIKALLKEQLEESSGITKMKNDKILFTIIKEQGEHIIKQLVFKQLGIGDFSGELSIEDQSDGTAKILMLIPVLYDVIENEKVICIDEIENSIHPNLITALIEYFSTADSKGQLIFTTHETELLNQQRLMRPDEVWFTEKHNGTSKLYSLNDFKEHNTINIKNGYLEGRYGAIPFIGELN